MIRHIQRLALAAASTSAFLDCKQGRGDYEGEHYQVSDPVPPPPPPCEPVDIPGKWMFSVDAVKLLPPDEADRFGQIIQEIPPLDSKVMLIERHVGDLHFEFEGSTFTTNDGRIVLIPNGATIRLRSGSESCSRPPNVELRVPGRQSDAFVLHLKGGNE